MPLNGAAAGSGIDTLDYAGTGDGALKQLDEAYDAWIAELRSLGYAGLAAPQGFDESA